MSITLLFALFLVGPKAFPTSSDDATSCGVVVDAGSSASRLYVYKWRPRESTAKPGKLNLPTTLPVPEQTGFPKTVTPGLSKYAGDSSKAIEGINELCVSAK